MCRFFKKKKKYSLPFIAFFQALGLVIYCGLVGLLFWQGDKWFGPMSTFLGPAFVLVLFVVSTLISALIVLGHPFILFWEKKQTIEALKLVVYTIAWLIFFILLIILVFIVA
ncbi:hypothetical protein KKI19_00130 [Patescibacteria group bacterium]|nr:hypothetical protein [Patescibacteria group bacterium]